MAVSAGAIIISALVGVAGRTAWSIGEFYGKDKPIDKAVLRATAQYQQPEKDNVYVSLAEWVQQADFKDLLTRLKQGERPDFGQFADSLKSVAVGEFDAAKVTDTFLNLLVEELTDAYPSAVANRMEAIGKKRSDENAAVLSAVLQTQEIAKQSEDRIANIIEDVKNEILAKLATQTQFAPVSNPPIAETVSVQAAVETSSDAQLIVQQLAQQVSSVLTESEASGAMQKFLVDAAKNIKASIHGFPIVERISEIVEKYFFLLPHLKNSDEFMVTARFMRAHSMLLGAIRLGLSGQFPEAYSQLNGALIHCLQGWHMHGSTERALIFLKQDTGDKERARSKKEFRTGKLLDALGRQSRSVQKYCVFR